MKPTLLLKQSPKLSGIFFAGVSLATIASAQVATPVPGTKPAEAQPVPAKKSDEKAPTSEVPALQVTSSREKGLSSPKFTQALVDTPQTIVVVPKEVITQQGAQNLSDVLRNTPGITFLAGEGGNVASGDSFNMRGFDASSSIFVDGVRDSGSFNRDVFNIEQVEIAKGPAGADNGRGGTSGYVNLATKTPKLENFNRGTAVYGFSEDGGDPQRRTTFDFNHRLDNDLNNLIPGTALRLNLLGQDSGVPGRDHLENKTWGVSPSLALGLGTPTVVTIAGTYQKSDNLPDSGLPSVGLRKGLLLDPAGAPTTLTPVASPVTADISRNFYGFADEDYDEITNRNLTLKVDHELTDKIRLSNQTKVGDTKHEALTSYIQNPAAFDSVAGTITPRRLRTVTENEILSNQTNLNATFDTGFLRHDVSTGLDLTRETQFSPAYTAVNAAPTGVANPDPGRPSGAVPTLPANNPFSEARIETIGLYAFDTLHLTEKWLLNLSGRLDHYETDFSSLAAPTALIPAPTVAKINVSDDLFSWKTGLVFKPKPEGSLYVAYGNSFTPPGANFTFSATPGNANSPSVKPQEAHNYETGVKWDFFDRKLSTSLAFYRSINENISRNTGTAAAPVIVYDSEQVTQGVEFGVSGKITSEWLVFGGLGYIDSETKSQTATNGADLRYTPRISGSIWTTYALTKNLTIGGGAQYTQTVTRSTGGPVTGSATNATDSYVIVDVPSYTVFNAMATYQVTENISVRLNVNNVFAEEYYSINNNGGRYLQGDPRNYMLTADFSF